MAILLGNITPPLLITGAIGLGPEVELRPEILTALPAGHQTFLGSSLITGGLATLVLNLALPKTPRSKSPQKRGSSPGSSTCRS